MEEYRLTIFTYMKMFMKPILLYLLFLCIFISVFFLYGIDLEIIFYASVLCSAIACGVAFYEYWAMKKKVEQLWHINIHSNLWDEKLPESKDVIEEAYSQMIETLREDLRLSHTKWQKERNDSFDYYSTWVHQIKTPIAVMRLMLQGDDSQQNQELMAELFRIEQYVEMVLSYFRLDESSNDFVFETCKLDTIIKQVIHKFAGQFIRKRITLTYAGSEEEALTDRKWLGFVLEQVLSNAIKYTDHGAIHIYVKDQCIYIQDTGIGISPEDLPRIFEKGFTGYNGHSDRKSTGIGLYLCNKAIKKLSHRMQVTSKVKEGTTVLLDLSMKKIDIE